MTSVTIGKFDGFHMGHQKLLKELLDTGADETVVCKIDLPGPGLLTRREQDAFLAGFGIDRLVRIPFTGEFARQTPEEFVRTILVEKLKAEVKPKVAKDIEKQAGHPSVKGMTEFSRQVRKALGK